jgi:hypothetical protein
MRGHPHRREAEPVSERQTAANIGAYCLVLITFMLRIT